MKYGTLVLVAALSTQAQGCSAPDEPRADEDVGAPLPPDVPPPPCPHDDPPRELPAPTLCGTTRALEGDFTITSQDDLDALVDCEQIVGALYVLGPEITNIDALHALREVTSSLQIGRDTPADPPSRVCSLGGLASLERVGGTLSFLASHVDTLDALTSLDEVVSLNVIDNPRLSALFTAPHAVRFRELHVSGNPFLKALPELVSLPSSLTSVALYENARLTDVSGLSSLAGVDDYLTVRDNQSLAMLDSWSSLRSVGTLMIERNPNLRHVPFTNGLTSIDLIIIADNSALQDAAFSGDLTSLLYLTVTKNRSLAALDLGGAQVLESVKITSNPRLDDRALLDWAAVAFTGDEKNLKIAGNAGSTPYQDPCPFEDDYDCDAPPENTLCADGTDVLDCEGHPED
jgi:hypothetical protein